MATAAAAFAHPDLVRSFDMGDRMGDTAYLLDTERTRLRPWRLADAPALVEMNRQPDMLRYANEDRADTLPEAVRWIEEQQRYLSSHGYGIVALEERASGALIGFVGLATPTFLPELLPATDIGWRIRRELWNRGLATEAARAVLDWAHGPLGIPEVLAISNAGNRASIRVMEKLGMVLGRAATVPETGTPVVVYVSKAPAERQRVEDGART
ncbi:GNAT family N-acetyltransferase [Glycomyces luteolus]|uniref:GNAT family N-acetyltransferase n=1 Tax=Glycomyces luteolus TaxID=2670330 RepID=A0A9X3P8Y4_9ACTN|nr:GNAT family N-acetyltransferase [Glycomyces luteolus]MDA1359138.1 GNAT family N-acetyltransferase [Glycomyces luteolus]